jgi:hypothetical protein
MRESRRFTFLFTWKPRPVEDIRGQVMNTQNVKFRLVDSIASLICFMLYSPVVQTTVRRVLS